MQAKLRILSNFGGKISKRAKHKLHAKLGGHARGAPKISRVACPPSLAPRVYFARSIISRRNYGLLASEYRKLSPFSGLVEKFLTKGHRST